jgi:hypothetical protein
MTSTDIDKLFSYVRIGKKGSDCGKDRAFSNREIPAGGWKRDRVQMAVYLHAGAASLKLTVGDDGSCTLRMMSAPRFAVESGWYHGQIVPFTYVKGLSFCYGTSQYLAEGPARPSFKERSV